MISAIAPVDLGLTVEHAEVVAGWPLTLCVRLSAQRPLLVRGMTVELATRLTYYHKEGGLYAGRSLGRARRTEVRASQDVPGPWPIEPGEVVQLPVTIPIPADGPGTTHVPLVDLTWWATARARVANFAETKVSRSFVVLSSARDLAHVAAAAPAGSDRGCARVGMAGLSSRSLAPGCPLSGTIGITPLRRCPIRGTRLELVVRQQVHHGEWIGEDPSRNPADQQMDRDTVVMTRSIGGPVVLDPSVPIRMPFTLLLPDELPAASLDTPNFTLTWLLRAVVDRRLRPDPYVEVPLHVRTTRD
jgi:hypothetical protein